MTLIIAGMDSFNPCAFFVLLSLLGLLIHAQSRRKMLLIGSIFVFFSGFIYFVFMAAWLNLFLVMGQVEIITKIAGSIAMLIAVINIKDFFIFKKGISLTIPDSAKPKLFDRMRKLLKSTSIVSILIGTAVLAIAANAYELLCTAGFPMVFTRILTLNNLSTFSYYLYLVLYNAIYVIPLSVIVIIFTVTLGKRSLSEWQGRILKLVSGTMMLGLGGLLLFDPAILSNAFVSLLLLIGAIAVSAFLAFLTKKFDRIIINLNHEGNQMKKIMFLCTANSCRSQMAEGFAKEYGKGIIEVYSAGLMAVGVQKRAIAVMKEIGIDISNQQSKEIDPDLLRKMDIVVTLCGHAEETCPWTPPEIKRIHWPIKDPVGTTGTEEQIMNEFRRARDEIKEKVQELIKEILKAMI